MTRPRADAKRTAPNGSAPDPAPPSTMLEDVPLDQIHVTFDTQARVTIDSHIVNEYAEAMEAGAKFPRVILFRDAEGFWPGDGHHRCLAARQAGRDTIQAEVREGGPWDAFLHACEANLTHGLRPTALDKRQALRRLLMDKKCRKWSDRELGRRCGMDHKTVAKERVKVTGDFPSERTYTTKHGTVATMDTSRIGAREAPPAARTDETPPATTAAGDSRASTPRNGPPTGAEGRWLDPLGPVQANLRTALDGFESFGGMAAVVRGWPPEHQQAFAERVDYVDELWQQFLRTYRDVPEAVRLGEAEAAPTDPGAGEEETL
jgi:hypothetical protein